jgi:hypothetical protein
MVTLDVRFSSDYGTIWLEFKLWYGDDHKHTYKFHAKRLQASN